MKKQVAHSNLNPKARYVLPYVICHFVGVLPFAITQTFDASFDGTKNSCSFNLYFSEEVDYSIL